MSFDLSSFGLLPCDSEDLQIFLRKKKILENDQLLSI